MTTLANTAFMPESITRIESDAMLVARLQAGDPDAYETLVRIHGGRLLSVARRFLPNNEDAQDAVQEAFIKAFRAIGTFEERAQLHTWLHRILVNTALMKIRSRKRRPEESIDDLLPTFHADGHQTTESRDWSDAIFERKETAAMVRQAIAQLPDHYRVVLTLRDIEERDTMETAAALGTTTTVVKVRLHRARQALRTLLDREFQRLSASA
ncbi:MAG TPA: sigma-70 family RNA polymerase sigma factor [Vicinamibacterales bacterium]|nr:sigma-70 family RNA polymerase sigma factor [Vicinamibacterales bacterium]